MAKRPKTFRFGVAVDRARELSAEDADPGAVTLPDGWQAEHLLLAALVRCSLTSLRYHAHRAGADVVGEGKASGLVTKRESDGRYAFVEVEASFDVELEPAFEGEALGELLAKAERDCFIAASLTVAPAYRWTVNGLPASAGRPVDRPAPNPHSTGS